MTIKMHEAIYWKNPGAKISIAGDEIKDWPAELGKVPDKATIEQWEAEYAVHEAAIKAEADKKQADIVAAKESIGTIAEAVDKATTIAGLKLQVADLIRQIKILMG